MITVTEAFRLVMENPLPGSVEKINLSSSLNRVLAQDIFADRDAPPFHRVTMDGIALKASMINKTTIFPIEAIQAAGQEQLSLGKEENCIEVMTGAVLPANTDCVIPYEKIQIIDNKAKILNHSFSAFQNVHLKGTDAQLGDVLLPKNTYIHPGTIGVLATVGQSEIEVYKNPNIVICSTGDELVNISDTPLTHQIRKSNVYMLQAALKDLGIDAKTVHIRDDKAQLKKVLANLLEEHEILLFSGAVSMGKFDFLPEVLEELNIIKIIHGVSQKPGKPFLFGMDESHRVFGFPGNPASTLICFHAYFKPWLMQHLGRKINRNEACLSQEIIFKKPVSYHILVRVKGEGEILKVEPVSNSGSGDLVHLAEADGFLTLPADQEIYEKGSVFPLTYLHHSWL
ncbi:MAG: molybdopterin molybdotransferase MoeA [Cyclobacteriaceae bacterium]